MTGNNIVVALVQAIAEVEEVEPRQLEFSLAEYIDPDVLVKLDDMDSNFWEATFRVADHEVTLSHRGAIFIDGDVVRRSFEPETERFP